MPRTRKSRYADNYRTLLAMLIEQRQRAGITQVELAKRMRTSQSMLSKLERGVVRMDLTDLLDYLDGIDGSPLEFIEEYIERSRWTKSGRRVAR